MNFKVDINNPFPIPINEKKEENKEIKNLKQQLAEKDKQIEEVEREKGHKICLLEQTCDNLRQVLTAKDKEIEELRFTIIKLTKHFCLDGKVKNEGE